MLYGLIERDNQSLEQGLTLGAGLALNTAVSFGLKKLINRPRPYETYPEIIPTNFESSASFPSAHTSMAFNFATSLTLQYPKWYIAAPAYTWATAVGFARMNQGVHYPSDVLGGMVVGTGCAFATWYANKWIRREWRKRKPRRLITQYP
jgi:membrane-associated phospholipid phosphatase